MITITTIFSRSLAFQTVAVIFNQRQSNWAGQSGNI